MVKLGKAEEERALRLHRHALVVDTHCDTLMKLIPEKERKPQPRRLGERSDQGHIDLPRLIDGGVDCQTFAIYTGEHENEPWALRTALQMVDLLDRECKANEGIVQVRSYDEILAANRVGKVAALLSIEGAEPLMGDLGVLRIFHKLGVRMLRRCGKSSASASSTTSPTSATAASGTSWM